MDREVENKILNAQPCNKEEEEDWLQELATSVKNAEKSSSAVNTNKEKKEDNTKKDVAVSSFFENLLKK